MMNNQIKVGFILASQNMVNDPFMEVSILISIFGKY